MTRRRLDNAAAHAKATFPGGTVAFRVKWVSMGIHIAQAVVVSDSGVSRLSFDAEAVWPSRDDAVADITAAGYRVLGE